MNDYIKNVRITISSDRYDKTDTVKNEIQHEHFDYVTEGKLISDSGRISLVYNDSDLFEGEKTDVTLTFEESSPELVSMIRNGNVSATLVFEAEKRHVSIYKTPIMPFEICIRTKNIKNKLISRGILELDYFIEIHGVSIERNIMKISVTSNE